MNSLKLMTESATEFLGIESLGSEKFGSSAEVNAELQRILGSPQFDASDRNRRFLAYVVEETLAGRGERIKAYNIATIVFGRDESFDPQLDPVVRMEARRLRRSLERFYLVEGAGSALRIAMPKGSYVPKFQDVVAQEAAKFDPTGWGREPIPPFPAIAISVTPFEVEDDGQSHKNHSDALCRQIALELSRFPEVEVFIPRADVARNPGRDLSPSGGAQGLSFALEGNAALSENALRVTATLVSAGHGKVVWGEAFKQEFADKGIIWSRERIASSIVRALAGSLDEILIDRGHSDLRHLPASLESVLRFKQYRRHARQDLFLAARTCLERLVEVDPNDSEAMACLSQIYSDGHRCAFAEDQPAELQSRAIELARKSIELAPNSSRGHHALGIALWFSGDADACIETLHRARALNPNSVDAVADLGLFLCLRGEWAEGISFINDANEGNCASSGLHRLGLSLHQFLNGQFEQALSEARRTRAEGVPGAMVAQAIALVRLGHKQEAIAVLARIRRRRSDGARDVLGGLGGGLVQSALAAEIRSALREADSVPANVAMM